ncbi:hypothetical protein DEU56DRAFT_873160 [Suillus clintonianus]|uniref:uncharacterized protein n=1 Tax=Suillus clintonianus TaxID=1904413 RepID=UPI001B8631B2|nr:uncharacterized protein DEU56DRAFT_873160 [Suillus clintonianus]KAG2125023.1 hypothetical protein DEU56DRAFT_873160 [Suillus clintonianus]
MQTSYYPTPSMISANGHYPPRSPPPYGLSLRSTHSPRSSVDRDSQIAASIEDSALVEPSKHTDLWFSDGSIVLRAENTLFRVHKSQLARHSAFFRDLFSLPQPSAGSATSSSSTVVGNRKPALQIDTTNETEGCPVLRLYDTAEDVENLITALYDGPSFGKNDPADFRMVSGILRLATKYLVDSLRTKALAHLSRAWPNSLKGWDAREDLARADEMQSGPGMSNIYPSPADVVILAREVNATSLLPSAFYDLSRYHYTQIFEQDDESGPSIARLPLSNADLQRLALGKEASQHAITTLIRSMGSHSHPHLLGHHAHSHRSCRRDFSELVALATQHYLFDRERGCTDPLYVAEELGQPLYDFGQASGADDARFGESRRSAEVSECEACARALAMWATRERERMWKMIPLWFRLDV